MPVKGLTQEEIDAATRAQVASGAKSTDRANRLPGETATEANARITAAYKEMTAKPILSKEQIDGGMKVQFVRTAAGGAGEYVPIKPIGYTGPTKVTQFTPGVIPANSKYTTGTSLGFNPDDYKDEEDRARIAAKLAAGQKLTADEQVFMNRSVSKSGASSNQNTTATGKTGLTQVVGSSIADWEKDPVTGKKRTPQEIIAAVTEAVLADKSNSYGTSLDPLTGKPRPATDAEKVRIALNQLAANAKFESSRLQSAQELSTVLGAGGGTALALANRPDLWALGKETVGTIIDRQNFGDAKSSKRFVVDPTKNQLTPEQLAQFNQIGASGGMAIDPVTGFQVNIDAQGRYTLGGQSGGVSADGTERTEVSRIQNANGSVTVQYSDGDTITFGTGGGGGYLPTETDERFLADSAGSIGRAERQSAYDLLYSQFNQYGLATLVEPLKGLITGGASPAEFTIRLRESDAYKKRFAANQARIQKGLAAISEAEYLGLEDQYQTIMRNYGLPANYYTRGDMGRQEGFEKFIANDVSSAELEDRIMTAQQRVMNANPEVVASLRQFYPDISNGDILAYALDPDKGLSEIKRKVTAAEIGSGALQAGLGITGARAEELGAAGVTKQQAQQGFQTVAEVAPRGGQLAAIYGESPYTQQTAEQEVFGLAGSVDAAKQRRKLVGLERAAFSGQTGAAQGALGRERSGAV